MLITFYTCMLINRTLSQKMCETFYKRAYGNNFNKHANLLNLLGLDNIQELFYECKHKNQTSLTVFKYMYSFPDRLL